MRGVYVLDLDNNNYFVMSGNEVQTVITDCIILLHQMKSPIKYDGSFHYYPILLDETEYEAEKRIYLMVAKKNGIQGVYARKEVLHSIGKGTWTTDMEIKNLNRTDSISSIKEASTEKDLFQMSI